MWCQQVKQTFFVDVSSHISMLHLCVISGVGHFIADTQKSLCCLLLQVDTRHVLKFYKDLFSV